MLFRSKNKIEKLDNTQEIKRFSDNSILTNNNNHVIGQDLEQDNIYNNKFWNINSNLSNMFEEENQRGVIEDYVVELHSIATVLEKLVGQGNITEDLRELADRLSDYNKGLQWTI